jgi:hypothetical protein
VGSFFCPAAILPGFLPAIPYLKKSKYAGCPKTAICCVSEKIQTAYVSAIHCAP